MDAHGAGKSLTNDRCEVGVPIFGQKRDRLSEINWSKVVTFQCRSSLTLLRHYLSVCSVPAGAKAPAGITRWRKI